MKDIKQYYGNYWTNFLKQERQPLWCEVDRLEITAFFYWQSHLKYEPVGSKDRLDSLLEFVKNAKRPYGNKNIPASIAFSLGWGKGEEANEYMTNRAIREADKVHLALIKQLQTNPISNFI